jgi:glycosyltransferase involved in cell wall biosynthesis
VARSAVPEEDAGEPSAAGGDRPLRILQVASPWVPVPPQQYGGSEWIAHWLCEGLGARGHDVTLVATADSSTDVRVVSAFDERPSGMGEDIAPELVQTLEAREAIDRIRPDVVHDHAFVSPVAAAGDTAYVVTAHSAGHPPFDEYYRRLSRRISLVAISDAQRRHLPDARWADTVPNAIDVASFPLGGGGEDFVFLGRITETKGADVAAEAAHRAGASLVLAGRVELPEEEAYFEERLRPLIDERVLFLGEVDTDQKRSLLAGARAMLFPIDWDEPFGMVVVESLACGTPVIAFRRGAVPELIEDGVTGFVVDDVEGMVQAMGRVGELDRGACRRSVEGRFDIDRMVDGYEALYRRLLREAA